MKLVPGKYKTRDGRDAIVHRVGALVGSGVIVGFGPEVWQLDGRWCFTAGVQNSRDLVAMVPEVVKA